MKKNFFTFFVFCSIAIQAQWDYAFISNYQGYKSQLVFNGNYSIQSNAVTNDFNSILLFKGGYVDLALKDKILGRLKKQNRYGVEASYGVSYAIANSNKKVDLFIVAENKQYVNAAFSKDLMSLLLFGNKNYAGKSAALNDVSINSLQYQKYGLGLTFNAVDSVAKLGLALSFLNGNNATSLNIKKGSLYTSEDGSYIDLLADYDYAQSDTSQTKLGTMNGYGFSADLFFEAPFKTSYGKSKIGIQVKDIGFIKWNTRSITSQKDTAYHFEGYRIDNIFQLQQSSLGNNNQDSIIQNIIPTEKKSFDQLIPIDFNLYLISGIGEKFNLISGVRYLYNANYTPLFYLRGNFFVKKKTILSTGIGYGGYGKFNFSVGWDQDLGKGFVVRLSSNNIEGFLAPKITTSQGAFITLKKYFL